MIRRLVVAGLLAALALPAAAQTSPAPLATPAPALPRVALETSAGRIVIELETVKAPVTAANFLRYVDQKKLDGVVFYRDVKVADRFGFIQFGTDGDAKRTLPPIKHEPTSETGLHHTDGTISVARLGLGTARGDFTISVGDQTASLDAGHGQPEDGQGYAAFGHVVEGMDVVVKILDAPVSLTATRRGAFQGQVPEAPVTVVSARRVKD
ncbi:peptidylprolyl isomerase [Sphingomonas sp. NFR15]|uniref:peptidylprolyl isomerase n=1 Tax=Sphingomonas sp. NFR15 TaxID=1566282 RepID=UPI00088A6504|nr:peptidylprolyl isomerase [Sphingomonas sp. NFR15]SDA12818.1 peptidyl-prolyl cis-trans isomerase A (cyclophilin A) [Sphingomonas sp. NFR15]